MDADLKQSILAGIYREETLVRWLEQASMHAHGSQDGLWGAEDHALMAAQRRLASLRAYLASLKPA